MLNCCNMKGIEWMLLLLFFNAPVVSSDTTTTTCIDQLSTLCPASTESTPMACGNCARANSAMLLDAGCTVITATAFCKNVGIDSTCKNVLTELCSDTIEANQTVAACGQCARDNRNSLMAVDCTGESVSSLCNAIGGSNVVGDGGNNMEVPDTVLPIGATQSAPLRVFIESGQSNCVGQASSDMMNKDPNYDELKGYQDGIWFAGLQVGAAPLDASRFYMGPMLAGQASKGGNSFGPEVSLGRRLFAARKEHDSSLTPVLIVKYCWGGSNLASQWNPTTPENSWNREEDNGKAVWLLNDGAADLNSKKHLYGNLIYTIRRSLETLEEGGIPYQLEGFFWFQGAADKKRTWQEYGQDTVTFFDSLRRDLGAPFLPIVDEGTVHHNTKTGKHYAASVIEGCNAVVTSVNFAVPYPVDDCIVGPSNPCPESTFINYKVFEHYGYDPSFNEPEFSEIKPPGSTNKTFHWFKAFPNNMHAEYEYKILQGRAAANAYILSFTDDVLLDEWRLDDIALLFPIDPCDPAVDDGKPSDENICWMDQREDADRGGVNTTCSIMTTTTTSSNITGRSSGRVSTRWSPSLVMLFFFIFVGAFVLS